MLGSAKTNWPLLTLTSWVKGTSSFVDEWQCLLKCRVVRALQLSKLLVESPFICKSAECPYTPLWDQCWSFNFKISWVIFLSIVDSFGLFAYSLQIQVILNSLFLTIFPPRQCFQCFQYRQCFRIWKTPRSTLVWWATALTRSYIYKDDHCSYWSSDDK